jgi:hypothetical protein
MYLVTIETNTVPKGHLFDIQTINYFFVKYFVRKWTFLYEDGQAPSPRSQGRGCRFLLNLI